MALDLTAYRVFIASPSNLDEERRTFRAVVEDYSRTEAIPRKVEFHAVGWEETLAKIGRPQDVINRDVRTCDYFVLVLGDRWGSPTGNRKEHGAYTSGVEEELSIALECLKDVESPMQDIVILFKAVDPSKLSDPGSQLQRVLDFRRRLEETKAVLYRTFDNIKEFEQILRSHLAQWLRDFDLELPNRKLLNIADISQLDGIVRSVQPPNEILELGELLRDAEYLAYVGKFTDAEARFAKAVYGTDNVGALLRYGRFLRRIDRLNHAQVTFDRVLVIAKSTADLESELEALSNLGVIFRKSNDLARAERVHQDAIRIAHELGESGKKWLAYNFGNLGQIYLELGDLKKAEEAQLSALQIQEQTGDDEDMSHTLGNLGVLARRRGEFADAEKYHRRGVMVGERLKERGERAVAYNSGNLGRVLFELGRTEEARAAHMRAIEINEKLNWEDGIAYGSEGLGWIEYANNNAIEATKYAEKAIAINRKLNNQWQLSDSYNLLGCIHLLEGDHKKAYDALHLAKEIGEDCKDDFSIAKSQMYIGDLMKATDKVEDACGIWRDAMELLTIGSDEGLLQKIQSRIRESCGE